MFMKSDLKGEVFEKTRGGAKSWRLCLQARVRASCPPRAGIDFTLKQGRSEAQVSWPEGALGTPKTSELQLGSCTKLDLKPHR